MVAWNLNLIASSREIASIIIIASLKVGMQACQPNLVKNIEVSEKNP